MPATRMSTSGACPRLPSGGTRSLIRSSPSSNAAALERAAGCTLRFRQPLPRELPKLLASLALSKSSTEALDASAAAPAIFQTLWQPSRTSNAKNVGLTLIRYLTVADVSTARPTQSLLLEAGRP